MLKTRVITDKKVIEKMEKIKEKTEEFIPYEEIKKSLDDYKYTWYKTAYWFVLREVPLIPKYIKWKIQKLFRGYSDCDLWGLDDHLAKIINKRLRVFAKMKKHGVPSQFADKKDIDEASKDWDEVLAKMVYAFDYVINEPSNFDDSKEVADEKYKKHEEGMKLFAKHFMNLWD